jgi:uncharacterized protein YehS (DUF1456 family)
MSDSKTKTRRFEKTFLVFYQIEADGDMLITRMTKPDIEAFSRNRDHSDYAVVDGQLLKHFDKKLDIGRVK